MLIKIGPVQPPTPSTEFEFEDQETDYFEYLVQQAGYLEQQAEYFEYLYQNYGWSETEEGVNVTSAVFDLSDLLDSFIDFIGIDGLDGIDGFEPFKRSQSPELSKSFLMEGFEEYFNGDWREGQGIRKVILTQSLYQISPHSTQAWFLNNGVNPGLKLQFLLNLSQHAGVQLLIQFRIWRITLRRFAFDPPKFRESIGSKKGL